ncbi:unnamed protein product [Amoebophrya sp. A120]|nr:unnamed protein product [Amoebophrya sp. A120]|eukprot:GSA120T00006814001.1
MKNGRKTSRGGRAAGPEPPLANAHPGSEGAHRVAHGSAAPWCFFARPLASERGARGALAARLAARLAPVSLCRTRPPAILWWASSLVLIGREGAYFVSSPDLGWALAPLLRLGGHQHCPRGPCLFGCMRKNEHGRALAQARGPCVT